MVLKSTRNLTEGSIDRQDEVTGACSGSMFEVERVMKCIA
jgi:hypothetical protein